MAALLALTVFALLVARAMRAPRGTWRWIVGAALVLALLAPLLPEGNPYRISPVSLRRLGWLALAMLPVLAYAAVLRRLRHHTGADRPDAMAPAHPIGLVRFDEDMALAGETGAALDAGTRAALGAVPAVVSLGWRTADGELAGHLRLGVTGEIADIQQIRVVAAHQRRGIGRRLVAGAAEAGGGLGARRLTARVGSWQTPGFFEACGFKPLAEIGAGRGATQAWMVQELP